MELTDELVPREPFTHHYINLLLQSLVRVQLAHFKESLHISLRNDPRYLVHVLLSNLYTSFEASTTLEASNSFPEVSLAGEDYGFLAIFIHQNILLLHISSILSIRIPSANGLKRNLAHRLVMG